MGWLFDKRKKRNLLGYQSSARKNHIFPSVLFECDDVCDSLLKGKKDKQYLLNPRFILEGHLEKNEEDDCHFNNSLDKSNNSYILSPTILFDFNNMDKVYLTKDGLNSLKAFENAKNEGMFDSVSTSYDALYFAHDMALFSSCLALINDGRFEILKSDDDVLLMADKLKNQSLNLKK